MARLPPVRKPRPEFRGQVVAGGLGFAARFFGRVGDGRRDPPARGRLLTSACPFGMEGIQIGDAVGLDLRAEHMPPPWIGLCGCQPLHQGLCRRVGSGGGMFFRMAQQPFQPVAFGQ